MPQLLELRNPSCFRSGMDKESHSPRELARKKREAEALKANLKRRKEAARAIKRPATGKAD